MKIIKWFLKIFFGFLILFLIQEQAFAKQIKIVSSLPDLASIAAYIGGDKVEVYSILKGNSNPHQVEVLPSYIMKASRADIFLKCGLALDQWADSIIDQARNDKLIVIDCSKNIEVLEKPSKNDSSINGLGDVHPQGNPHYWLDPVNGNIIADNILAGLKTVSPETEKLFEDNTKNFKEENNQRYQVLKNKIASLNEIKIVTYHTSWSYFIKAFGLKNMAYIEPFPGIPPSGKHLAKILNIIKTEGIKILIQEPYFTEDAAKFLSRESGIRVYQFSPSCQGTEANAYWDHFEQIINKLSQK